MFCRIITKQSNKVFKITNRNYSREKFLQTVINLKTNQNKSKEDINLIFSLRENLKGENDYSHLVTESRTGLDYRKETVYTDGVLLNILKECEFNNYNEKECDLIGNFVKSQIKKSIEFAIYNVKYICEWFFHEACHHHNILLNENSEKVYKYSHLIKEINFLLTGMDLRKKDVQSIFDSFNEIQQILNKLEKNPNKDYNSINSCLERIELATKCAKSIDHLNNLNKLINDIKVFNPEVLSLLIQLNTNIVEINNNVTLLKYM